MAACTVDISDALDVSDTGPGIPPEECERICEKIRQVDGPNTRAKGARGSVSPLPERSSTCTVPTVGLQGDLPFSDLKALQKVDVI